MRVAEHICRPQCVGAYFQRAIDFAEAKQHQAQRGFGMDLGALSKLVRRGGIALGHPTGCSGTRIVVALIHELHRSGSRYGLATLCVSGGQGMARPNANCAVSTQRHQALVHTTAGRSPCAANLRRAW